MNIRRKISLFAAHLFAFAGCLSGTAVAQSGAEAADSRSDARLTLAPEKGGALPGEPLAGRVEQRGEARLERVVAKPGEGSPHAVMFSGRGEVEIELPAAEGRGKGAEVPLYHALRIRPSIGPELEAVTVLELGGARLGFSHAFGEARGGTVGQLLLWREGPQGGDWESTGIHFTIDEEGKAGSHLTLGARVDPQAKRWDLYFNGKRVLEDLALSRPGRAIRVLTSGDAETSIGALWQGEANPYERRPEYGRVE